MHGHPVSLVGNYLHSDVDSWTGQLDLVSGVCRYM